MPTSDSESEEIIKLDEDGMVAEGPYGGPEGGMNPGIVYPIMYIVQNALGALCAWGIYKLDEDTYDVKIRLLRAQELGYLYIAVRILTLVLDFQQVFVAVGRKIAKAENPDQYIYKTMLREQPYIRLEMEGVIGEFNRAQRAIDNTREKFATILADVLLGGYVFPKPMLTCVCIYFVSRMAFSCGYMQTVKSRTPGQAISFLVLMVIGGMNLLSGILALS